MSFQISRLLKIGLAFIISFTAAGWGNGSRQALPGLVRSAHASTTLMNISFVGGGAIHLVFTDWLGNPGNPDNLTVIVKVNGANFTTLFFPAGTIKYRHAGLPLGSIVTYIDQLTGETLTGADTSRLGGTMLFDENIDSVTINTSGDSEVIVGGSNSLTISNSIIRHGLGISTRENGSAHVVRTSVEEYAGFSNDASQTNRAIIVEDSVFEGQGVSLNGGISFKSNEVRNRVSIWRHSDILIQNNIIEGPISYECHIDMSDCDWSQGPYPTILGNSFLGDTAFLKPFFISLPITHVGSNYYGDPNVVNNSVNSWGDHHRIFLKERGAWNASDGQIVMDSIASWGNTVQKLKPSMESVHLNSYIIGQNTIAHKSKVWSGMMERRTLLSIDLGTSFSTLSGVKVIVHFNGKDYVKRDITLHHTIHDCVESDGGKCTINFELDPVIYVDSPGVNIPITVDVDLSEVPDSKYLTPYQVINDTIGFFSPPKRPMKINVVPIRMGWLCSGSAEGATTTSILRDYLPAMFALRKQDIDVRLLPPHTYNCLTPLAALSATLIAEGIIAETTAIDKVLESDPADLLVVVVPFQALKSLVSTDIEGMSLKGLRSVILVNDAFPDAVLHEMGHWAGMYYDPEEYDQFQPAGLPFRNSTAYDPDGKNVFEMKRQIEHFTEPGFYGWKVDKIYDTMSNQKYTWPLYETSQSMQIAIYNLLGHKGAASPVEAQASAPAAFASGMRTLYFYSETIRDAAGGGYGGYFLKPGSPHVLDLTGMGLNPGDSPERTTPYTKHLSYDLTGYDAAGTPVFSTPIVTYLNDDYGTVEIPSIAFIYHTIQVPENVVRVVVTDPPAISNQIYLDQSLGGSVELQFVTPTAGSTLGSGDITLTWTNPSPHLLHLLAYSADNGLTWNSSGDLPFEGDFL